MENKTEDEIRKRWEQEAKDKAEQDEETQQRPKKRVRAIEYHAGPDTMSDDALEEGLGFATTNGRSATKGGNGPRKKTGRAAAGKAKGKIAEILGDEERVIELD